MQYRLGLSDRDVQAYISSLHVSDGKIYSNRFESIHSAES